MFGAGGGPSRSSARVQKGSARGGASAPLGFRLATEPHRGCGWAAGVGILVEEALLAGDFVAELVVAQVGWLGFFGGLVGIFLLWGFLLRGFFHRFGV